MATDTLNLEQGQACEHVSLSPTLSFSLYPFSLGKREEHMSEGLIRMEKQRTGQREWKRCLCLECSV